MQAIFHYVRGRFPLLLTIEAAVLVSSMVLGYHIRWNTDDSPLPLIHGVVFAALMLLAMTALGLYEEVRDEPFRTTVQRVLMAYLATMVMLTVLFYFLPHAKVGRSVFAIASGIALAGVIAVRWIAHRIDARSAPARRVLVVGDEADAQEMAEQLADNNPRLSERIAGLHTLASVAGEGEVTAAELARLLRARGIDEVVVTGREQRGGAMPLELLLGLRLRGFQVRDLVSFYESELGLVKTDRMRMSWLVFNNGFEQSASRAIVKRAFDMVCSLGLLLLAAPLMLLAAIAILLETGRPVFFRQSRCGAGGRPFSVLKFRSMRQDAEKDGKPRWATQGDSRITPVGRILRKTRIDELPQLLNVLRGDMSFVGPRPERPYFVESLASQIPYYELRHNVKPGITGWAQVRLPYGDTVEAAARKLEYDLYYVKNHSPMFDLIILFETVQVVLRAKGQ